MVKKIIFFLCWSGLTLEVSQAVLPESKDKTLKESVYEAHSYLSGEVIKSTNWIDSFFGSKKSLEEKNGSRLRIYHILSKTESEELESDPAFKFDIRLPNLQKKLQLSIERKGKSESSSTPTEESTLSTEDDRTENESRGSLSVYLNEILDFNFKLTGGVRLGLPPRLFSKFRISRDFNLSSSWKSKFIATTFWDQGPGFGQSASLDIDKTLSKAFSFRWANDSTWLDETDTIRTSHGPTLFHRLSSRRGMSYNIRANYFNRPFFRLHEYVASIVYRQNLMRTWFYYELIPSVQFPRSNSYSAIYSFAIKVECIIGDY